VAFHFSDQTSWKLMYCKGYHVQITARSDRDLTPEGITQKIAESSGSKYSAGSEAPTVAVATKPTIPSKPAFTPTQNSGGGEYNRTARNTQTTSNQINVDGDGWGEDAPPVTRTQLEKVQSAYQPTKVNLKDMSAQNQNQPSFNDGRSNDSDPGAVKGAYQPVGKVDIAAIRRQAQQSGAMKDDRPEIVKGSYEPVGKVDIAAIRAKAQRPSESRISSSAQGAATSRDEPREESRPVSERIPAFSASERLTSLPKPKIGNKFGGSSSFTGTKAPTPAGFEAKALPASAPVGTASRTFADQGGKTPAQIWQEKKARERGLSGSADAIQPSYSGRAPLQSQTSGGSEWKSGYAGKSWAPIQTTPTGKSGGSSIAQQTTGDIEQSADDEAPRSPSGGVGSIRDRFSGAPPMGAPATNFERPAPEPDTSNKPNRGIPIPGLPTQRSGDGSAPSLPPAPPQPPRSPTPPTPEMRSISPIRVAMPVAREAAPDIADAHGEQMSPPPAMPVRSMQKSAPQPEPEDDEPEVGPDPARAQAQSTAAATFGQEAMEHVSSAGSAAGGGGGQRALVQYDYEAAGELPRILFSSTFTTRC
jgi:drebrin-like protein